MATTQSFVPPEDCPFAVIEAFCGGETLYVAPTSTKWLKNIRTAVNGKGNIILKCTAYWPRDEDTVHQLLMKHAEPDNSPTWLEAEENVTVFRFCRTLGEAKTGVEDAAELSSVTTQLSLGKRPHKPNKKFVIASDSDEEPPQKNQKKNNSNKQPVPLSGKLRITSSTYESINNEKESPVQEEAETLMRHGEEEAETERKRKSEAERKKEAEERKKEAEERKKEAEERKKEAEAERKRKAEAERKKEAEERKKEAEERKKEAEAERKRKAEAERKRKAEAERKKEEEMQRKKEAEAERKKGAEAERKKRAEAERERKAEAERKKQEEMQRKREYMYSVPACLERIRKEKERKREEEERKEEKEGEERKKSGEMEDIAEDDTTSIADEDTNVIGANSDGDEADREIDGEISEVELTDKDTSPFLSESEHEESNISESLRPSVDKSKRRLTFSPVKEKNKKFYSTMNHHKRGAVSLAGISHDLGILTEKVDTLTARINAIYLTVCPATAARDNNDNDSGLPTLPMTDVAEVENLGRFLEVEEQKISAVVILADCGGTNLRDTVFAIMRKLFNNKLASRFNLLGRNRAGEATAPKLGLKTYKSLHDVIHAAVKRRAKKLFTRTKVDMYDRAQTDIFISNWLKDAPKRCKNEKDKSD